MYSDGCCEAICGIERKPIGALRQAGAAKQEMTSSVIGFHFIFHYPYYITPNIHLESLYNSYITPIIPVVYGYPKSSAPWPGCSRSQDDPWQQAAAEKGPLAPRAKEFGGGQHLAATGFAYHLWHIALDHRISLGVGSFSAGRNVLEPSARERLS